LKVFDDLVNSLVLHGDLTSGARVLTEDTVDAREFVAEFGDFDGGERGEMI
jgi:hypothetical protein